MKRLISPDQSEVPLGPDDRAVSVPISIDSSDGPPEFVCGSGRRTLHGRARPTALDVELEFD